MNYRIIVPAVYAILLGMFLIFLLSMMGSVTGNNPKLLAILDGLQSLLAMLLFAVVARFTGRLELKRAILKNRWLICFSFFVSILGCIAGYMLYDNLAVFITPIIEGLRERIRQSGSLSTHLFPVMIFANNTRVSSLTGLLLGSVPVLGLLYSLLMLFSNGALIGFVAHFPGNSISYIAVAILPHGIFEIPALLLASSVALRINISMLKGLYFIFRNREEAAHEEARYAFEAAKLFAIIIPLLFVAALIESYVTPLTIRWFKG